MTTEEVFDAIYKDVKKYQKEGKIIKIFAPEESPRVVSVEGLCDQWVDGLLYDLDMDEAVLMTVYKDKPLAFADEMAKATVIRFLHKFYMDNKDKIKENESDI